MHIRNTISRVTFALNDSLLIAYGRRGKACKIITNVGGNSIFHTGTPEWHAASFNSSNKTMRAKYSLHRTLWTSLTEERDSDLPVKARQPPKGRVLLAQTPRQAVPQWYISYPLYSQKTHPLRGLPWSPMLFPTPPDAVREKRVTLSSSFPRTLSEQYRPHHSILAFGYDA